MVSWDFFFEHLTHESTQKINIKPSPSCHAKCPTLCQSKQFRSDCSIAPAALSAIHTFNMRIVWEEKKQGRKGGVLTRTRVPPMVHITPILHSELSVIKIQTRNPSLNNPEYVYIN